MKAIDDVHPLLSNHARFHEIRLVYWFHLRSRDDRLPANKLSDAAALAGSNSLLAYGHSCHNGPQDLLFLKSAVTAIRDRFFCNRRGHSLFVNKTNLDRHLMKNEIAYADLLNKHLLVGDHWTTNLSPFGWAETADYVDQNQIFHHAIGPCLLSKRHQRLRQ